MLVEQAPELAALGLMDSELEKRVELARAPPSSYLLLALRQVLAIQIRNYESICDI